MKEYFIDLEHRFKTQYKFGAIDANLLDDFEFILDIQEVLDLYYIECLQEIFNDWSYCRYTNMYYKSSGTEYAWEFI